MAPGGRWRRWRGKLSGLGGLPASSCDCSSSCTAWRPCVTCCSIAVRACTMSVPSLLPISAALMLCCGDRDPATPILQPLGRVSVVATQHRTHFRQASLKRSKAASDGRLVLVGEHRAASKPAERPPRKQTGSAFKPFRSHRPSGLIVQPPDCTVVASSVLKGANAVGLCSAATCRLPGACGASRAA